MQRISTLITLALILAIPACDSEAEPEDVMDRDGLDVANTVTISAASAADAKVTNTTITSWRFTQTSDGVTVVGRNLADATVFAGWIATTTVNGERVVNAMASFEKHTGSYSVSESGEILASSGDTAGVAAGLALAHADLQAASADSKLAIPKWLKCVGASLAVVAACNPEVLLTPIGPQSCAGVLVYWTKYCFD